MPVSLDFFVIVCLIVFVWFSFRFGWWRKTVSYEKPRILMYHMIALHKPRARFNKLRVEPTEFEKQVRWLYENGWTFVHMSELGGKDSYKRVALTFDDGYRDNLLMADPVLEKYDAKATVYLVVDRHNRDWSTLRKSHHDEGELMEEPKLTNEDVEGMVQSGRWELGAHTNTHVSLVDAEEPKREEEIRTSKVNLERQFRQRVDTFAYPFGIFGPTDVMHARQAGYQTAVTTEPGISVDIAAESLMLRRVKVSGSDGILAFRIRMRTGKCRFKD